MGLEIEPAPNPADRRRRQTAERRSIGLKRPITLKCIALGMNR